MDEQKKDGPDIIDMGEGVRIIDDVLTAYGIDTLEGRVGPRLRPQGEPGEFLVVYLSTQYRMSRFFVDDQLEYIGSCIVSDNVKIKFPPGHFG
jgi:hypothetical protein